MNPISDLITIDIFQDYKRVPKLSRSVEYYPIDRAEGDYYYDYDDDDDDYYYYYYYY